MVDVDADLSGQVALVTGSTSGLGRATALGLATQGARILVHGRDVERGETVVATIEEETPGTASFLPADLDEQAAVRDLATRVRDGADRLDVLVCNAGVYRSTRALSADGIERTFAINHLAHFLLTYELAERLVAGRGRVVVVSSGLHRDGTIHFGNVDLAGTYTGKRAYAQSKLANVLFAVELADRLPAGTTANAVHPGTAPGTRLSRGMHLPMRIGWRILDLVGLARTAPAGADSVVYLAASPAVEGTSGEYFVDREPRRPAPAAADQSKRRRLWQESARLVGVSPLLPVQSTADIVEDL